MTSTQAYDFKEMRNDRTALAFAAISVFFFFLWGAYGGMNMGFTVSYAALFTVSGIYLIPKRNITLFTAVCSVLSCLFALAMPFSTFIVIKACCFLSCVFFYVLFVAGASGAAIFKTDSQKYLLNIFYIPCFLTFLGVPHMIEMFSAKSGKKQSTVGFLLLGLILALPALIVIIPLLVSSDAAFEGLLSNVLNDAGKYIACAFLTVICTPLLFCLLIKLRKHDGSEKERYGKIKLDCVNPYLVYGFLGSVCLIYAVYLLSQLAYVVGGMRGILPEGFTVTDYARRGFFELCAISVINLIIISLSALFCKLKNDGNLTIALRAFIAFFCIFDLFLVGASAAKMYMYVLRFGLTRKRLYVFIIMIMMALVFLITLARLFIKKLPYIALILTLCSLVCLGFAFADPDRMIAEYNINAYQSGKLESLDFDNLSNLSEGSTKTIYDFWLSCENAEDKQKASNILGDKYTYEFFSENGNFERFNFTKESARKALDSWKKLNVQSAR